MNNEMTINWTALEAIGTILAAVFALFIAFLPDIKRYFRRPKLDVLPITPRPPDCIRIPTTFISEGKPIFDVDSYYARMKVINRGKTRANDVEVYANKLFSQQVDGSFKEVESFLPMNLRWAHRDAILPGISPDMIRHISIIGIIDPEKRGLLPFQQKEWNNISPKKTILSFNTDKKTNDKGYLQPHGKYRLELEIGASNVKPIYRSVEIILSGEWFDDFDEMFSKGVGFNLVDD